MGLLVLRNYGENIVALEEPDGTKCLYRTREWIRVLIKKCENTVQRETPNITQWLQTFTQKRYFHM